MDTRIADIMKTRVRTIRQHSPVEMAIYKMQINAIRHLVIVDEKSYVQGIISKSDLLRHLANALIADIVHPGETPVGEVMMPHPRTVSPDTKVTRAAALMAKNRIGCLPVVNTKKHLIGIVSVIDLLESIAKRGSVYEC